MGIVRFIEVAFCKVLIFISIVLLLCGCWEKNYDYYYSIKIRNTTKDTLLISLNHGGFLSEGDLKDGMIYPDSSTFLSGRKLMRNESVIPEIFSGGWEALDSCWIYIFKSEMLSFAREDNHIGGLYYPSNEQLKKVWHGGFVYMGDSINNFFNYDSWKIVSKEGVEFTLYKSDLY